MNGGITVRRSRGYSVVPDHIFTDQRLQPVTRLALAWAIGRGDGWVIRVGHLQHTLGVSDKVWRRTVRPELEQHGYLRQWRERHADTGKFLWHIEIFDEPHEPQSIPPGGTDGEGTDGGGRDASGMDARQAGYHTQGISNKKENRQQHASATPDAKARRKRPSGLVTWTADDMKEAARLERDNDAGVLRAACAAISLHGKEPLPGRVSGYIERQAQAKQIAERQAVIDQRLAVRPPVDDGRVRDGLRLLSPALRRRVASAAGIKEETP